MSWDAEQWSRRFQLGATDAERYVRENRARIARSDPRSESAKGAVDTYSAKADLYGELLGATGSRQALSHRIEDLQMGAIPHRSDIYERARYESAWRRECDALAKELASGNAE